MDLLKKVASFEGQKDEIETALFAILAEEFRAKRLNGGKLPTKRTPQESIRIISFGVTPNDTISVVYEIWWGGDCYDKNCYHEIITPTAVQKLYRQQHEKMFLFLAKFGTSRFSIQSQETLSEMYKFLTRQ